MGGRGDPHGRAGFDWPSENRSRCCQCQPEATWVPEAQRRVQDLIEVPRHFHSIPAGSIIIHVVYIEASAGNKLPSACSKSLRPKWPGRSNAATKIAVATLNTAQTNNRQASATA